jgi:methyl-accepting chemotaxis protein
MAEQAQTFKQMTSNTVNISKQIKSIAAANRDNSQSTAVILERIQEVRGVSRENGESAKLIAEMMGDGRETKSPLPRRNSRRGSGPSATETGEGT